MDIRNYLSLFERGRIIWLGPGSEKIWNFDGRNKIWDPWVNAFMEIIAQSGILIFKGTQALSARTFGKEGQTEHFEGTLSNKHMLIQFIHSSVKIASFVNMLKLTKAENAAVSGGKFVLLEEEESNCASAVDKDGELTEEEDPLGLAKLSQNPKSSTKSSPAKAEPVPPTPAAESTCAPGDWSKGKKKSGKTVASSEGGQTAISSATTIRAGKIILAPALA